MPRLPERSPQRIRDRERGLLYPTHRIKARRPERFLNKDTYAVIEDPTSLGAVISDEAKFPGGYTTKAVKFKSSASEAEISHIVQETAHEGKSVVIRAAGTSLTGAVVPRGEVVLDMSQQDRIGRRETNAQGEQFVTVQAGVTIRALHRHLKDEGLFLPSAPTYEDATVGGAVSTDASGARGYKYGKTRDYVEGLTMVLASGEVIEVNRGQYIAHAPDNDHSDNYYFELEHTDGRINTIAVPTYTMPDVPKVSAGYYAKPGMDLIDLIVGSEGTLGVITDIKLKLQKEPPTVIALIPCASDEQAVELIKELRNQEPEKRASGEPGGISAVEYIGENAVKLLKQQGRNVQGGNALLLVQVEMPEGNLDSLAQFVDTCDRIGIPQIYPAIPGEPSKEEYEKEKERFIDLRETVPHAVNDMIAALKAKDEQEQRKARSDNPMSKITKVGSDPCVRPEDIGKMIRLYREALEAAGLEYYAWGHGEGNIHFNAIPRNVAEVERAKTIISECGQKVIQGLGGSGTAEHGVGKNAAKQLLLKSLYREKGIDQMRWVKAAFDPQGIMSPDNIFPKAT